MLHAKAERTPFYDICSQLTSCHALELLHKQAHMSLEQVFLVLERLVAEGMAHCLPLTCVTDIVCSKDADWRPIRIRPVKRETLGKRRRAMAVDIFPHLWFDEGQLIGREANHRPILFMQILYP